jgi:general secretion pathway protein E
VSAQPVIGNEDLQEARTVAAQTQKRALEVLEEKLGLAPDEFMRRLGETLRYPVLSIHDLHELTPAFDLLPYSEAQQHECMALRTGAGELLLVFSDPFRPEVRAWAEHRVRAPAAWHLAHPGDLAALMKRHEDTLLAMDSLPLGAGKIAGPALGADVTLRSISEDASPVVRLVNSTVYDAMKCHASDIHLESDAGGLCIKYRIDGVLSAVKTLSGVELAEQVISRVKVMAELDIADRRIPQDGRFRLSVCGREVDFRVSIMPCIFGEDAVLRILDKQSLADQVQGLRLSHLGFDEATIAWLRRLASEPYGMLLVTGPTGSGKTTTLYAAVSEINHGTDKIITIEDPVEYQLPGVLQIPVNEKKGLSFARGLRSILRHDPDKIMVGEIRDAETAQIAVQSALTGHLVFTTVHANNVFDVIGRLTHIGVDPYSLVAALNGVVAQRLVRVNCPHCSVEYVPDGKLLADSGLDLESARNGFLFRRGVGCGQCRGTGYKGRKAIAESLHLNDEIRELILAREPIRRFKEAARRHGTRFLRGSALELVRCGETTLQEINRVTFVE